MIDTVRYSIIFKGLVQGVGFRYFVYRTAQLHDLTGSVQNLDDGSVEVEVQGPETDLASFLATVRKGNGISIIRDFQIRSIDLQPSERSFEVY